MPVVRDVHHRPEKLRSMRPRTKSRMPSLKAPDDVAIAADPFRGERDRRRRRACGNSTISNAANAPFLDRGHRPTAFSSPPDCPKRTRRRRETQIVVTKREMRLYRPEVGVYPNVKWLVFSRNDTNIERKLWVDIPG